LTGLVVARSHWQSAYWRRPPSRRTIRRGRLPTSSPLLPAAGPTSFRASSASSSPNSSASPSSSRTFHRFSQRHCRRRQGGAGRLHAHHRPYRQHGGQSEPIRAPALRSHPQLRTDRYAGEISFRSRGQQKLPRSIDRLHNEAEKALAIPIVQQRIAADGGEPFIMPLTEITPFVQSEIAKWADVVKRAGVTVQ